MSELRDLIRILFRHRSKDTDLNLQVNLIKFSVNCIYYYQRWDDSGIGIGIGIGTFSRWAESESELDRLLNFQLESEFNAGIGIGIGI